MNEYITIDEHDRFIKLKTKFNKCMDRCGKEIFEMKYGREMGDWYINDYELKKGIYLVWFENPHDDETVTIDVPIIYMCDELCRKNYNAYLNDLRSKKEDAKKIEEQKKKNENIKNQEIHDRSEYARLKRKYEDPEKWGTSATIPFWVK